MQHDFEMEVCTDSRSQPSMLLQAHSLGMPNFWHANHIVKKHAM